MIEHARAATDADVDLLTALTEEAVLGLAGQRGGAMFLRREARRPPWRDSWRRSLADPDEVVVVGTVDDHVVGLASLAVEQLADGGRLGRVTDLYVTPEARGVGIGEQMMELLWEAAVRHGCEGVDATALPGDRATKNFFERFGLVARSIIVHRVIADDDASGAS